jgi:outer membrane biogenesis lipoprotein LolB
MLRVLLGLLLASLLLAGCGSPAPAEPQVSESDKPLVTVYKTPT